MSRTRPLDTWIVTALTTVCLVAAGMATTPASAVREPFIQGVVVDQEDRPVLNVEVAAFDEDGKIAASDLSYENVTADGDPQRGYFALHLGSTGTYTVVLSKTGYVTETITELVVERGALHASLGEITLTKRRALTTATGRLKDSQIAPGDRARVAVTVVTKVTGKPTGKVQVRAGGSVVGASSLRATDGGRLTVTLDRLARGTHALRAYFLGSSTLKASPTAGFTLTVKRAARPRITRPNALAYIG